MITNQRNPAWSGNRLGNGSVTIGGYGCTISCIGMLAGEYPDEAERKMREVGGFSSSMVIWSKINEAFPNLVFEKRVRYCNWDEINGAVGNFGACLIEVDFDNNVRTDGRHWVVYTHDGMIYDPWTGEIKPRDYNIVTGYSIIQTRVNMLPLSDRSIHVINALGNEGLEPCFVDGDNIYPDQLMRIQRREVDELVTLRNMVPVLNKQVADLTAKLAKASAPQDVTALKAKIKALEDKRTGVIAKLNALLKQFTEVVRSA